jgi:hypothetical protein
VTLVRGPLRGERFQCDIHGYFNRFLTNNQVKFEKSIQGIELLFYVITV